MGMAVVGSKNIGLRVGFLRTGLIIASFKDSWPGSKERLIISSR